MFNATGNTQTNNLVVLLTDGNPYKYSEQSVCANGDTTKESLDAADITVIIVGMGDSWSMSALACLVNDTNTQIIDVLTIDTDAFNQARNFTDPWICGS